MKMSAGLFWGLILMLIGIGLVIKVIFNVDFPIFKFIVAFFLIFLGIKLLVGNFNVFHFKSDGNDVAFSERTFYGLPDDGNEYNVIFGKAVIDLRDVEINNGRQIIDVKVVFGGAEIWLPKGTPVKVKAEVVFGGTELPDGNAGGFGSSVWTSENYDENSNYLYIRTNAVFGGIEIE